MLYIVFAMKGTFLKEARERAGWTQVRLAKRLGVTQAYLSLLETGKRHLPSHLVRRLARLLDLPATMLPVMETSASRGRLTNEWFEAQLARLDYPGFAYRKRPGTRLHPAEVLLAGLAFEDLEPRLVEALPWLVLHYDGLNWEQLVACAKARDLQNRLGFVVSLARKVAESKQEFERRRQDLRHLEEGLEPSRLAREETFGQGHASEGLRTWLRSKQSEAAGHWNLLTDLQPEHLPYAS
ncbi:MAG: hypothetical protein DMF52_00795 [Acidobacteria bacterium]|nr:MAG: hypothetical protein DMF52_00795 [Acidobacteriota bacterium]